MSPKNPVKGTIVQYFLLDSSPVLAVLRKYVELCCKSRLLLLIGFRQCRRLLQKSSCLCENEVTWWSRPDLHVKWWFMSHAPTWGRLKRPQDCQKSADASRPVGYTVHSLQHSEATSSLLQTTANQLLQAGYTDNHSVQHKSERRNSQSQ